MINVRYYKTVTDRKNDTVFGEFFTQVIPEEVRPVDESLKGKKLEEDKRRYKEDIEQAKLNAQVKAIDMVREIIGLRGLLVAFEVEEEQ